MKKLELKFGVSALSKEQMKKIGGGMKTINCIYYYSDGSWDVDEIEAGGGEEAQAYCDAECWGDSGCTNCSCSG